MERLAHLFNLHARQNVGDAALVEAAVVVLRELWPHVAISAATRYRDDDEWLRSLGTTPVRPAVRFPAPGEGADALRAARLVASLAGARVRPRIDVARDGDRGIPDVALS